MKRHVLLMLTIFLTTHLFGQIGKGDVFISVNGNYSKHYSISGVSTNDFGTDGKYLELGTSVEYFLTDRLSAGIGLDYQWSKETKGSFLYLKFPDINYIHDQTTLSKSYAFLPNVFFKRYIPISSKLYFNTNLQVGYGKIKLEDISKIIDINDSNEYGVMHNIEDYPTYLVTNSKQSEVDFLTAQLGPELTYFLSPKFVGCLSMGGVEYGMFDGDTDNSIWSVNFNPVYWKLGFKIKI